MESELGLTFGLCVPFFWGNTCKLHSPFPGLMVGCGPGQKAPGAAKSEWFCHFCSGIELGEWALRHSLGQLHHSTFACRSLGPGINELSSQTKWQFCRLQKLFFPRSIVIFCHFSNNFRYVSILLRKWRQNDNRWQNFPPNDQKNGKQNDNFASCKNCIFLGALSFFCHCFGTFQTIFDIFPCCWENGTKMTKQRQNFHQMTQNDRPKLKWQKKQQKTTKKWQTKLKWQKMKKTNDKKMKK